MYMNKRNVGKMMIQRLKNYQNQMIELKTLLSFCRY